MKKTIIAIIALTCAIGAMAQKETLSLTLNGGYNHMGDPNIQCAAFGAYVGFWGVYLGVQFNPADKSTSLDVGEWGNQSQIYTYHLGYRFSIREKIGITPLVGLTQGAIGWVDGYDWRYDDTHGVVNKFNATDQRTAADVGVMLDYATPRVQGFGWKFCATITLHTASVGVGFYM